MKGTAQSEVSLSDFEMLIDGQLVQVSRTLAVVDPATSGVIAHCACASLE